MKLQWPAMSLRSRVMLRAGLALTFLLIADTVAREHGMEVAGRRSLSERASLLVAIQAEALSVPVWNLDRDQLGAALEALVRDPDFIAASVVLPDGRVLDERHEPSAEPLVTVHRDIVYRSHGELRTLGTLYLRLSTARLNADLRRSFRTEAAALTFLLGFVLLILYATLQQVVRPLDRLAEALTRLAAGDRDTPIPASDRDDEVGAVARGLEVFRDTAFKLMKAEGTYRALFDNAPIGMLGTDETGRLQSLNEAMLRLTGYSDTAALAAAMHRDDGSAFYVQAGRRAELYAMMRASDGIADQSAEIRRADGSHALISMTGRAVRDETGRVLGFTGTMEDITDRQRRREEEQLRLRAAMECASDAILIVDSKGRALFVNPAFERCFGYSREAFSTLGGLPAVLTDPAAASALSLALYRGEAWQREADIRMADGRALPLLIRASTIRDGHGASFGCVVICTDLSDRRQAEARIQYMAHYDWLTSLPNRLLFRERLSVALGQCTRDNGAFALLALDLDRFKAVNDTLGHAAGDRLLQLVGARLQRAIREGDTVARVGGDEFIVIQLGLRHVDQAVSLAERLIQDLSQPFDLNGREAQIGTSIGIALAPLHSNDPDRLLGFADLALYEAKTHGKCQLRVFTPDMDLVQRARTALEQDLRRAVAENSLILHFQPQYRLSSGVLLGAEALLRWTDPERGIVSPADFIPVAEESGLIHPIGQFVLQTACREAAAWPNALRVAVNVSPAQFHAGDLIEAVGRVLRETGLAPARLELEITEGVLLRDTEATRATLLGLKTLGVRITLDDFGTGYSSLSYLRRMPFDKIKIDRSFVSALGQDEAATALVRSIIALANGLGLEANAEGVETKQQARLLRDEGCHEVQGFYFGRPMAASAFTDLQNETRLAKIA
jgi:diguanylate cyclase (GGDEF)-like protein/PAS domain S-box-containing protein